MVVVSQEMEVQVRNSLFYKIELLLKFDLVFW